MSLVSDLRSNGRLRVGLALIVAIVWLYELLDLQDRNAIVLDQYKQTALQLARFGGQQNQKQWSARADSARAALSIAESGLWHNATLGLAQAETQDWLTQQLHSVKAVSYLVKVAESEAGPDKKSGKSDGPPDLSQVRAKLEFKSDPKVLNNLLLRMSTSAHQIIVESMLVNPTKTELTVSAWYALQPLSRSQQGLGSKAGHTGNEEKN